MAQTPILLLLRPRAQSERFAAGLTGCLGALPRVVAPLMEIVPQPLTIDPEPYATLIFTSENGVASFAAQSPLRDRPAWCVGPRTAAAAAEAGFAVRSATAPGGAAQARGGPATAPDGTGTAPCGTAEALIAALTAARPAAPLLHLRGAHAVTDLAGRLRAEGLACDEAVVYAQDERPPTPEALTTLAGAAPVLVPLFSPRSARLAAAAARAARPHGRGAPLHVVAISPAAAECWCAGLAEDDPSVTVAARPDAGGMIEALNGACRRLSP